MSNNILEQNTPTTAPSFLDNAISKEGKAITSFRQKAINEYHTSMVIGLQKIELTRELNASIHEHLVMAGLSAQETINLLAAYENAKKFIAILPNFIPKPELTIESDNEVSFDWIQSKGKIFSVSVGSNRILNYATVNGQNRNHGKELLNDEFPGIFSLFIERIF